ncbi:uncharacterized protein LOC122507257 [Leptopilina heterotoma]|uniref:uncharacterized protein LOC122507257 n=1 Tax=Leptopilina heterotoma TaxID=63436 RepID=UPI001CA7CB5B|nr:uncharacterized protein LOC122507257 [Leptopilina heterotoma]
MISTFIGVDHRNWDMHVHEFRHAVNTATQAATKTSPAFLNYGRHPKPVKSLRREIENKREVVRIEPEDWVDRIKRLDALRDMVARHIDKERARQTKYYDKGRRDVTFKVGDLVLRKSHKLSSGTQKFATKLAPKYKGPFKITEIRSPTVFILQDDQSRRVPKVHITDLIPYLPIPKL